MSIKKYELEPTDDNVYESIKTNVLARNKYVWRFCKLLNEIDDSCVLALNAKWGEGKTFFVKQAKMFVESYSGALHDYSDREAFINDEIRKYVNKDHYEKELKSQLCFYYDAWENDDDEDPVISLLYYMAKQENIDLRETHIMDQLLTITDQFSAVKIRDVVDKEKKKGILKQKKNKEEIKGIIGDFLETVHIEKGERAVIFIDELDRCKPTYAVKLLERIKHYFNFENLTFVFSVNLSELQHTVKEFYGEGFDGCGYLNRFFDHILDIPEPDMKYYLETIEFDYNANYFEIYAKEVIRQYGFSIREAEKYVRTLKIAIGKWVKNKNHTNYLNDEKRRSWSAIGSIMIPIMIGLKIKGINEYSKFVNGDGIDLFLELTNNMIQECFWTELLKKASETYESTPEDSKEVVSEEKRLKELYNAIFNDDKKRDILIQIGTLNIFNDIKTDLINACSMLSDYTLFDE